MGFEIASVALILSAFALVVYFSRGKKKFNATVGRIAKTSPVISEKCVGSEEAGMKKDREWGGEFAVLFSSRAYHSQYGFPKTLNNRGPSRIPTGLSKIRSRYLIVRSDMDLSITLQWAFAQ
jgi:hypothetical protein